MALAGYTCGDRWGLGIIPAQTLWDLCSGPPSTLLIGCGTLGAWGWVGRETATAQQTPPSSRNPETMWVTGSSCGSPGAPALLLRLPPLPYGPPPAQGRRLGPCQSGQPLPAQMAPLVHRTREHGPLAFHPEVLLRERRTEPREVPVLSASVSTSPWLLHAARMQ